MTNNKFKRIIDTDVTFESAQRGAEFYISEGLVTGKLVIEKSFCDTHWCIIEITNRNS